MGASEPVSFERAVERFIEHYISPKTTRPFSVTSKRNVRDNLLGSPLNAFRAKHGITAIDEWKGDDAAAYLRWLQMDLRRDSATVKKVRGQLRSFGAFCDKEFGTAHAAGGALATFTVSTVADFDRPKERPLTHAEARVLLKAAPTLRDRLAIAMLLYTGMRPSELLALEEAGIHLDWVPPVVEVRGSVHDADSAGAKTESRDVPLTIGQTTLVKLIRMHLADPERPPVRGLIFLSKRGARRTWQPLSLDGLRAMLADVGVETGIKCNAYRLRHTFCTWCATAGMAMSLLQQLLGLKNADMVAPYYRGKKDQGAVEVAARLRF
ncbi:MAG: tyrosine-type recombinase/integrase [Candidatus Dormibacteria bacterium]